MSASWRNLAKHVVPAPVRRAWRRWRAPRWFSGDFATWAEARACTAGYDAEAVLQRAVDAAREVRAGRAAWERDGTTFATPALHQPLLAALQAAAGGVRQLVVVDFGGALGSTWHQHRRALERIVARWRIVEQPAFVDAGRREFSDEVVSFHASLDEACGFGPPDVILLSSVLPYVEAPHELLAALVRRRPPHVILDRMPFIAGERDRLVIQTTPDALGGGSYPCWLFAQESVAAHFTRDYIQRADWPVDFDQTDSFVAYRGMHFELRADFTGRAGSPAS